MMTSYLKVPTDANVVDPQVREDSYVLPLDHGERWWGGAIEDGRHMPFGLEEFTRDLETPLHDSGPIASPSNQSSPLLVSTAGRYVWSDHPFEFSFKNNELHVSGRQILVNKTGTTLREAFVAASAAHFPASGVAPDQQMFTGPQYNTWIDIPRTPTQDAVVAYVRDMLDSGMPPGVVFIDDCWSPDFGNWVFDLARFPDPAGMVRQLKEWGCSVMLWVVPFVSADSIQFRELERRNLLVRTSTGDTAVRRWWNGLSALLDLSNPTAIKWLTDQLDTLVEEFGIDGFKFDAGDIRDYKIDDQIFEQIEPVDMCERWARVGLRYGFNEFRACWGLGGQAIGQRLQDKAPVWGPDGIGSLISEMLAQSMIGHSFTCPDMIGGGEIEAMLLQEKTDQEFYLRYAQVAALAPMMQFSVSPSRVLDPEHYAMLMDTLKVREGLMPLILELVDAAAQTGEPIMRPMAYHAPEFPEVTDQFFLGSDLFVAPVTEKGATSRVVAVPAGTWLADDGQVIVGPAQISIEVPLARLPRFERHGN